MYKAPSAQSVDTQVFDAIMKKDVRQVSRLVNEYNININAPLKECSTFWRGLTTLELVIRSKNENMLSCLVEECRAKVKEDIFNSANISYEHIRNVNIYKTLVDNGANPNAMNSYGKTILMRMLDVATSPLMIAIDVIEFFVDRIDVDFQIKDTKGNEVLDYIFYRLDLIFSSHASIETEQVIKNRFFEVLKKALIRTKGDINEIFYRQSDELTLLSKKPIEVIKLLIEHNVQVKPEERSKLISIDFNLSNYIEAQKFFNESLNGQLVEFLDRSLEQKEIIQKMFVNRMVHDGGFLFEAVARAFDNLPDQVKIAIVCKVTSLQNNHISYDAKVSGDDDYHTQDLVVLKAKIVPNESQKKHLTKNLTDAVTKGDINGIQHLINEYDFDISTFPLSRFGGRTPLAVAAKWEKEDVVNFLVDEIKVKVPKDFFLGWGVLENLKIFKKLIEGGADVNAKNEDNGPIFLEYFQRPYSENKAFLDFFVNCKDVDFNIETRGRVTAISYCFTDSRFLQDDYKNIFETVVMRTKGDINAMFYQKQNSLSEKPLEVVKFLIEHNVQVKPEEVAKLVGKDFNLSNYIKAQNFFNESLNGQPVEFLDRSVEQKEIIQEMFVNKMVHDGGFSKQVRQAFSKLPADVQEAISRKVTSFQDEHISDDAKVSGDDDYHTQDLVVLKAKIVPNKSEKEELAHNLTDALKNECKDTIRHLINQYDFDISTFPLTRFGGRTPLAVAVMKDKENMVNFLVDEIKVKVPKDFFLLGLIFPKNLKILKKLIEGGADVNAKDEFNGPFFLDYFGLPCAENKAFLDFFVNCKDVDFNIETRGGITALSYCFTDSRFLQDDYKNIFETVVMRTKGDINKMFYQKQNSLLYIPIEAVKFLIEHNVIVQPLEKGPLVQKGRDDISHYIKAQDFFNNSLDGKKVGEFSSLPEKEQEIVKEMFVNKIAHDDYELSDQILLAFETIPAKAREAILHKIIPSQDEHISDDAKVSGDDPTDEIAAPTKSPINDDMTGRVNGDNCPHPESFLNAYSPYMLGNEDNLHTAIVEFLKIKGHLSNFTKDGEKLSDILTGFMGNDNFEQLLEQANAYEAKPTGDAADSHHTEAL